MFATNQDNSRFSFFSKPVSTNNSNQITALNGTQKNITETTLFFIFAEIEERILAKKQDEKMVFDDGINALNAVFQESLTAEEEKTFQNLELWDSIKQMRDIVAHPYPQNRYHGNGSAYQYKDLKGRDPITEEESVGCQTGVYEKFVYYFKSGFGSEVLTEPQGILGLTARNDDITKATKEAVVEMFALLFEDQIARWKKYDQLCKLWPDLFTFETLKNLISKNLPNTRFDELYSAIVISTLEKKETNEEIQQWSMYSPPALVSLKLFLNTVAPLPDEQFVEITKCNRIFEAIKNKLDFLNDHDEYNHDNRFRLTMQFS